MKILQLGIDFGKVASSLGLAHANYKPIPALDSNSASSSSSDGASGGRIASVLGGGESRNASIWGEPSVLHMPHSDDSGGRIASSSHQNSGKTVGSHGCEALDDYTPKDSLQVHFPAYNKTRANIMRYREQMGVNTGAWFVQENWMTASLFKCAGGSKSGELDVLEGYGTSSNGVNSARARMEKHWDTWITEKDFEKMAQMSINTVRLPIGYWTPGGNWTDNSPFAPYKSVYENSWKYFLRAVQWADKYNIGVLVDLHGAYGSQNGQPHSGVSNRGVQFYNNKNEQLTTDVLLWITEQTANITNVVGIELLNEPTNNPRLWTWYNKTMNAMRKVNKHAEDLPLYFHDAFNPSEGAKFAGKRNDFVVQDTHSYFVFTQKDTDTSASQHTSHIQGAIQDSMRTMAGTARGNFVVGEWSCALSPSSLKSSGNHRKSSSDFCQAQTNAYRNATAGAHFWSWTMENCDDNAGWCFKSAFSNYMDGSYNPWGFTSNVSNKTIADVSSSSASITMPSEYSDARSAALSNSTKCSSTPGLNAQVHTSSGHASGHAKHSSDSHSGSKHASSTHGHPSSSHAKHSSDSHSGSKHASSTHGHPSSSHDKHSSDSHSSSKHASSTHGHPSSSHAKHSSDSHSSSKHASSTHGHPSSSHAKHSSDSHSSSKHASSTHGHPSSSHAKHSSDSHSSSKHASSTHGHSSSGHSTHTSSSSHSHKREHSLPRRAAKMLGGSGAAAAGGHMAHRRAVQQKSVENLGYGDGFVSGRFFAELLTLNRIGFAEQYVQDTLKYYTKRKVINSKSGSSSYAKQFKAGRKQLEKEVTKLVRKTASSDSSGSGSG
ncbi:hypothetical protein MSPP1_001565 [Malassezia sp. CBS 17886]|nr:hypothetical protein MSPP1_001565 [Malassezia sp. CBS 17886]